VTESAGSSGQHWKDPPDAASTRLQQISTLQETKRKFGVILRVLHDAKLPLNLLEDNLVDVPVSDFFETANTSRNSEQEETVRLAAHLFSIALACRDIVEDKVFNEFLRSMRYTKENTEVLLAAFENLDDAWSAYEPVIALLDVAAWDRKPSPDRVWIALKTPRRDFIVALGAYYVQLLAVIKSLEVTKLFSSLQKG
jgi:hypothetical protein